MNFLRFALALFPLFLTAGCSPLPLCQEEDALAGGECVILLHGLGRSNRAMAEMAAALRKAGFRVVNLDYPSTEKNVAAIVRDDFSRALTCARKNYGCTTIHFVTHSLGGIVVRMAVKRQRPPELGRVVMLAPPNQGTELVSYLRQSWFWSPLFSMIMGPAGAELGPGPGSVPNILGPVDYPVGIIAGDNPRWFDYWFSRQIPGPDDGKVPVKRTMVKGMEDFILLPYGHSYIMKQPQVIAQCIHFLEKGCFNHEDSQLKPWPVIDAAGSK